MTTDYLGASAQAIAHHYDRGRDFYRLWLDPTMTYSCGLWAGAGSLDEAQALKLDHHAAAANVTPGSRVLDIGCGWGSMLRRLVERYGAVQATGLTLSGDQHDHVASLELPGTEVRLESWSDHHAETPYDAVISIGAMEHFARPEHDARGKVDAYRRFFDHVHGLLRPRARLSLQTIVFGTLDRLDPWIATRIWPESNLPRVAEVVEASERLFEVEELRNDRLDYARTCTAWADNLEARRTEVIDVAGEATFRDYARYLRMSARAFETGALGLVRMRLARTS